MTLDTRRRFWNFSGDLSGRWIEALAVLPPAGRSPADLAPLVARLLAQQRPDGRFGRTDLAFTAAETGNEHMALLWGNGRLLVGLMAYWQATRDAAVLAAARRLAGFLLAVREAAKAPEVMARVEGQGAFGFICFTQLAEGLAMLTQATGDGSYATAAREIVPLLPPRGVQHSHGYLSTLRGAVLLDEAAGDPAMLAFAERLYGDLVRSSDTTIDGGVMEYFGWGDAANATSLAAAKAASGAFPRNEGCGLSDFVRLSLQLHGATGKVEYLDRAERCLVNAFAHNQFANGDFGSRVYFDQGIQPSPSVDRAWWCCTMHGYRAFRDVLDHAVVERDGTVAVQLFEDVDFRGAKAGLSVRRTPAGLACEVTSGFEGVLAVREPSWADNPSLAWNGKPPRPDATGASSDSRAASPRATGSRCDSLRACASSPRRARRSRSAPWAPSPCAPRSTAARGSWSPTSRSTRSSSASPGRGTSSRFPATSRLARPPRDECASAPRTSTTGSAVPCRPSCGRWAKRRPTSRRRSRSGSTTAGRDRGYRIQPPAARDRLLSGAWARGPARVDREWTRQREVRPRSSRRSPPASPTR